jgi:hypothetical protein
MARYLLHCACGKALPVEAGQAGRQIVCSCGEAVDVPTLRLLRQLPVEPTADAGRPAGWSRKRGAAAAFLILAVVLTAVSFAVRRSAPRAAQFDGAKWQEAVDELIPKMTPADTWRWWLDYVRPLDEGGFVVFEGRLGAADQQEQSRKHLLGSLLLVTAGLCAAIAVCAAFWPAGAGRPPK